MDAVLLVTGASRGIGAAIALAGARAGYRVCINYNRSGPAAEELAARIASDGGHAISVQADVGDSGAVETLFLTRLAVSGMRAMRFRISLKSSGFL